MSEDCHDCCGGDPVVQKKPDGALRAIRGKRCDGMIYKLTDQDLRTYHGFQWKLGVEVRTSGEGGLCGPGWLHVYVDPLVAVLLNPIHANISDPRMFAEEGEVEIDDHGMKGGVTHLTLSHEIPVPAITTEQRVRFAVLCAKECYTEPAWVAWADGWLSGDDRSPEAAVAAAWEAARASVAAVAPEAAPEAAAVAAAWAAEAAWAAVAPEAAEAAVAAWAVAAAEAAEAAWAVAAEWAVRTAHINLPALARRAMEE